VHRAGPPGPDAVLQAQSAGRVLAEPGPRVRQHPQPGTTARPGSPGNASASRHSVTPVSVIQRLRRKGTGHTRVGRIRIGAPRSPPDTVSAPVIAVSAAACPWAVTGCCSWSGRSWTAREPPMPSDSDTSSYPALYGCHARRYHSAWPSATTPEHPHGMRVCWEAGWGPGARSTARSALQLLVVRALRSLLRVCRERLAARTASPGC
jgi:hypothetical protein